MHWHTDPVITVLVVSYRHERFVERCLESIRTQTAPARILIADDASPDGTADAIHTYFRKHPEIDAQFFPNMENRGLNPTLNALLARVDTEYVTYVSADDYLLPSRLAEGVKMLEADRDAVLGYSDALVVNENDEPLGLSSSEFTWPSDPNTLRHPFAQLLRHNWIPAASLMLRTRELREAGGYEESIFFEDYELLVRLSKKHPFACSASPLVAVRRLETSLSSTGFKIEDPRYLTALDTALRHYEDADHDLADPASHRRWELAKSSVSRMPPRDSLSMLWRTRHGAERRLALPRQLMRLGLFAARSARR